jgi:ASC-1-like (ASCH) protein
LDHIAIMKKSWGLLPKILSGKKTIESRWYKNKSAPWGKINKGDIVYFKNSGEPVTVRARVSKVLSFENLNKNKVREILYKYGKEDGINQNDLENFFNLFKDKRYCMLVFLDKPKLIEPFGINKKGFGAMAAWITLPDIGVLKTRC